LAQFRQFDWLWKDDMEAVYKRFMETNPDIEVRGCAQWHVCVCVLRVTRVCPSQDFNRELHRLGGVERSIDTLSPFHVIGALSLNTKNIKLQLRNECRAWKIQYSNRVHFEAKSMLSQLHDYITSTTHKLTKKVEGLDSLSFVMDVLRELRAQESFVEMKISPIMDLYQVLCCTVLCCAVLCCAVLCCAVLCCAVLCCAVLCCAVLCCAVLCCALQC
jgi:dynein heavy chain